MGAKKTKMSQDENQDWLILSHPGILEKIMLIVGLDSLESLDRCRQVCKSWNAMIMNKIWENPTKKWGKIIQRRIERSWGNEDYYPSDAKISQAKLLSKQTIKVSLTLIVQSCIVLETRGILTPNVIKSLARRVRRALVTSTSKVLRSCSMQEFDK